MHASAPQLGLCAGIGVVAAAVALLPWMVTGMRLPLQNLWAEPTLPADMPVALLPFSQYAVAQLLSLLVVGYGVAGLVVRALGTRLPRRAVPAVAAGALAVHLVAATQATRTVAAGLAERTASTLYLAALLAVVVAAVLTGLLVLRLVTAPPRAGAVIGSSLVAVLFGSWLADLVVPLGSAPGDGASSVADLAVRWAPAILVGAAIAWGCHGTRGRYLAAAGGLLLLWIVPAALSAVTSAASSRVLLRYPSELVAYGLEVLRAAAFAPELVLPPLLVALVVAGTGIALHRMLGRRPAEGGL